MSEPRFKKLRVWQEGMNLVKEIYEITKNFPKSEKYGLSSRFWKRNKEGLFSFYESS